jgi:hypothetical protein
LHKARSVRLGEAQQAEIEEPGQTANRIAESGQLAVERASGFYDALTTTDAQSEGKRRRDRIAAEGMSRPTL